MACCLALSAAGAPAQTNRFRADCEALTAAPHRLAGTAECRAAADYVSQRLAAAGADRVLVQEFPVMQTTDRRCELVVQGNASASLALVPMRPNGIIPPVTPPAGVSGPLVHLGAGRAQDYASGSIAGSIAVMDYNSGDRWLRAIRLGARAVIFVGGDGADSAHAHSLEANANVLRFYYPGSIADLPAGANVTVYSEVVWSKEAGRNVYAFFRGTAPVFGVENKEELLVLAADLDSFGDVPRMSAGARGAANVASLLKLADVIRQNRPRRHILLAFLDGEARGQAGVSRFYRALESEEAGATVAARTEILKKQSDFIRDVGVLVGREDPLSPGPDVAHDAHMAFYQYLRDKAAEHTFRISDTMQALRRERDALLKAAAADRSAGISRPDLPLRIEALKKALTEERQPEKDQWNALRRVIEQSARQANKSGADGLKDGVREKFDLLMEEVRQDFQLRKNDLADSEREIASDRELRDLLGNCAIVLHATLMLGDTTRRWGLILGGESAFAAEEDTPAAYGKIQTVFLKAWRDAEAGSGPTSQFVVGSADQTLSPTRMLWAAPHLISGGAIAGLCGVYNLVLGTCQERLPREGTPADTLDRLDLDSIESQADEIGRLLVGDPPPGPSVAEPADQLLRENAVANAAGLSLRQGIRPDRLYKLGDERPAVMGILPGGSIPDRPVRNAVVQIRGKAIPHGQPCARDNFLLAMTDSDGRYEIGPARGEEGFAAVFDSRGTAVEVADQTSQKQVLSRLNVFSCRPGLAVLPAQVRAARRTEPIKLFSAEGNSLLDPLKSSVAMGSGLVSWYSDRRAVNAIKLFGLGQIVVLNNGDESLALESRQNPQAAIGSGFPTEPELPTFSAAQRSAADFWRLNEARLQILRSKDIRDSSIEELHGRAEDVLLAAQAETEPVRRDALATCSFLAAQPVYRSVRSTLDDLVFAVLLLLLLAIPFAFVLERVVVGATTIYKQIGWFALFFVLTFLLLYKTHPAFAIASTPMVIFLGFSVMGLSILVISILMRRFDAELKAIQGTAGTVHSVDVSRISTLMAAMHMGVSTLRRRPMRTALTATTITLLTLTILCFASFGTQRGLVRLLRGTNPEYNGVWLHDLGWGALSPELPDVIAGRWSRSGTVCGRVWACSTGTVLSRRDGSNEMLLRGLVGFEGKELARRPDLAAVIGTNLEETILLTRQTAQRLGAQPGATVMVNGLALQVGPLLDAVALSNLKDMDGGSVLPVDQSMAAPPKEEEVASENTTDPASAMQVNWTPLPADSVALVSAETAVKLRGTVAAIAVYTPDTDTAGTIADDLARTLAVPVNATLHTGVYFHGLGVLLAASGARDLFFPILLGGLVIFGTMLGSVADREREIYTFSALGLAPRHVAMLFFAEAMVYSLLGGMVGYLLAQGMVKVMTVLSKHGLAVVPEMNVSSTNTIATILIVMGTVLISAIYPALKASRSANPGLMRTWRPPEPKGGVLDMVFPFTVSEYDFAGVLSFLQEHFASHNETGLGRFMASDVHLVRRAGGGLGLEARLALAPFDLGVGQSFQLWSAASGIPGIDEVNVRMERLSGQPKDWQRLYKVFLDDLRRQFLIWRSLPQETMDMYRQQTLTRKRDSNQ
jgi:hypothetical protein